MISAICTIVGFAAYSGTGKTTLVTQVIPELRNAGLKLSVIKHAHHGFVMDQPGKDSYELRAAGANQVLIASRNRVAWIKEDPRDNEPTLNELLKLQGDLVQDLIIVEGFKHEAFPKIEIFRRGRSKHLLARNDPHIIAVATDAPEEVDLDITLLDLNKPTEISQFILQRRQAGELTFQISRD